MRLKSISENPSPSMSTKKCLRCDEEKNVSFFPQDKRRPDGYVTICRKCVSAKRKLAYGSHSVKKEDITENIPCEGCRWTEN